MSSSLTPRLDGVRVVITRAEHQAAGLEKLLSAAGARVERLPLLELAPPQDPRPLARAASRLHTCDWVILTSANAVEAVAEALPGAWPATPRAAAVGTATAAALKRHGVEPALVSSRPRAEGLLRELAPHLRAGQRVLLPQAADARTLLAAGLRRRRLEVEVVEAYRKRLPDGARERFGALFAEAPYGWVTFTSPSTARAFAGLAGGDWAPRRQELLAASIGPVTSAALRELGVEPAAEAATPGEGGLAAAIRSAAVSDRMG